MELKFISEWEVGAHTGFSKTILKTLKCSIEKGMYTTQFFMGNPKSLSRTRIGKDDIEECKKLLKRFPLNVFTHFPYLANLSGQTDCLAWSGNEEQDKKTLFTLSNLEYELNIISNFNEKRSGVVIHPGFSKNREKGLKAISKSINKINFEKHSKLLLENSAGQGTSLATTLEELKMIIDNVEEDKKQNIGVCLDTCHTFAYGLYNLSLVSEVDRMFQDFDTIIGLDRLVLIHLNDSEKPFKSRKDRHALLGHGHIWSESFGSLLHLLNKCNEYSIPLVLETHCSDMFTLASLQND